VVSELEQCKGEKQAVVSELEQCKGEKGAVVSELEQCKGQAQAVNIIFSQTIIFFINHAFVLCMRQWCKLHPAILFVSS
jgi:hypothetical protein